MQGYLVHRLLLAGISLLGLTMLVFVLLRAIPGDAAVLILGGDAGADPEQLEAVRDSYGLNDPVPVQYARWLGDVIRGDFGSSLHNRQPVLGEIGNRITTTAELAALALLIGLAFGVSAGTFSAVMHGRAADHVVRLVSVVGLAVPNFWIGTMVIVFGARWFGWIPPVRHTEIWENPRQNLEMFIVPAMIVGLALAAVLARMTRSSVLEVLREDYVRTARAKGVPGRMVLIRHALRPGLVPVVTLFGVQVGIVVAGTVIVERVFSLPGLGRLMIESITRKDYPMVQGIVLLYGAFVVAVNLATDLAYGVIDPRLRV